MKNQSRFFIVIFVFAFLATFSIYFIINRTPKSIFLNGAINSVEINHLNNIKTIARYKELENILNYIDSIDYIEEPEMTVIRGGDTYSIRILRKNKKYDSEYLVFYHKNIHYICANHSPRKILVNIWYTGSEDIFNTVKNLYDKAKQ